MSEGEVREGPVQIGIEEVVAVVLTVAMLAVNLLVPRESIPSQIELLAQGVVIVAIVVLLMARFLSQSIRRFFIYVGIVLAVFLVGLNWHEHFRIKMVQEPRGEGAILLAPGRDFKSVSVFVNKPDVDTSGKVMKLQQSLAGDRVEVVLAETDLSEYEVAGVFFEFPRTYVVDVSGFRKMVVVARACDGQGKWPFKVRLISNPMHEKKDLYFADSAEGDLTVTPVQWVEHEFYLGEFDMISPSWEEHAKARLLREVSKVQILLRDEVNQFDGYASGIGGYPCNVEIREIRFEL